MIEILFYVLLFGALFVAMGGIISSRVGYVTMPFLVAVILLIWFLPQASMVIGNVSAVPEFGQIILLLLAILSFGAVILGWKSANAPIQGPIGRMRQRRSQPLAVALAQMNEGRLRLLVTVFVGFALIVQVLIQLQPSEALLARQPTGLITILRFFSTVNPIALFLSFAYYLSRRSLVSLLLFVLGLSVYAPTILLSFKRAEIIELGVSLAFCLWAMRRYAIPRIVLPGILFSGLVVLFGVSEFRSRIGYTLTSSGTIERQLPSISEVAQIDWLEVITVNFGSNAYEYVNGVYFIQDLWTSGYIGLGRGLWNAMVKLWVPGQLIGADLKQSMYFDVPILDSALERFGLYWQTGTTSTGFPEIYSDWNIVGFVLFFFIGRRVGRAFRGGMEGDLAHACTYPPMATMLILSITHGGYIFFQILPLILAFYFAIRLMTSRRKTRQVSLIRGAGW